MKLNVNEDRNIELREVFLPLVLITADGEQLSIYMRDSGFEFKYQGKWYSAKGGKVAPFREVKEGVLVYEENIGVVEGKLNTYPPNCFEDCHGIATCKCLRDAANDMEIL